MNNVKRSTHENRVIRWKAALLRLGINPRQAAERLGVARQTAYNWNCGSQTITEERLKQIEAMK